MNKYYIDKFYCGFCGKWILIKNAILPKNNYLRCPICNRQLRNKSKRSDDVIKKDKVVTL